MKKKFNWRNFISLYIALSFIIMLISGIILYIAPPGRIANWSYWSILGLTKKDWQSIHIIFTFIFVLTGGFHIYYNWKPLMYYLKSKRQSFYFFRYELIVALSAGMIIFLLTINQFPPFNIILDFGEYLTESWENEENSPPVSHIERLTLLELANTFSISISDIKNNFQNKNIEYYKLDNTLEEIAELNKTTPQNLFIIIKTENSIKTQSNNSGKGLGRRTIEDICIDQNLKLTIVLNKLLNHNIQAERLSTIKDIANKNNMLPIDIYNLIIQKEISR